MIKNLLFVVALLSLALAVGCATGGNGMGSGVAVAVSDTGNLTVLYVTQVEPFTVTVTGTGNTAVMWTLSNNGADCTNNPTLCGSFDPATDQYTAPATAPNPAQITITATSQADKTKSGSITVTIKQITVQIRPSPVNVGVGSTQQFVAVAVPDDAPQTFTWSQPTCTTAPCGTIVPDANNSALAVYTAPGAPTPGNDVKFIATSTIDTTGFSQATVTVVNSRLGGNSKVPTTYAFRFSGFNITGATALAGNFVVATDGITITSGVEDALTTGGPQHFATLTGSYTPTFNNQGKITLNASGGPSNTYTVTLDASGDLQMIESDSNGKGSGVIELVNGKFKDQTALTGNFVLGFTGVDLAGKRAGYVAFLPMDGAGNIGAGTTPGSIDINDNGTASSAGDVKGSYTMANGIGTMTFTSATLGKTFSFNLYGVDGQLNSSNPLTLYAISTDSIATNAAVSGTVVFQDPKGAPYNNATFSGTSVSALTGVDSTTPTNANVALIIATTDGSGNIGGTFDQNDAGTITGPAQSFGTGYKYSTAGCTGCGRYTVNLLGNPTANPPVPMQFILYATGPNQGFLLDQSSTSVLTGTMSLQLKNHTFGASEITGTYAAASTSSATNGVDAVAANLLLTWVNTGACTTQCVDGTQYVGTSAAATVTGAYTLMSTGDGTITLTAPSAQSYVIYTIDLSHFLMMDVDKSNTTPSIIFAQQ